MSVLTLTFLLLLMGCRRDVEIGVLTMREGVVEADPPTPLPTHAESEKRAGGAERVDMEEVVAEAIATPAPTPTRTLPEATAIYYTVGVGDTLSRIAMLYGTTVESLMRINGLSNANQIQIGQQIQVSYEAQYVSPADILVPDSEVVLGPGYADFDTAAYITQQNGYLATYSESVLGVTMQGAEIVELVALQYSVGPRILLALLELKGGWVTNALPSAYQQIFPLGYDGPDYWQGLYHQLILAADAVNSGFYGWWYDDIWMVQTQDTTYIRYSEQLNAGTAGIQYALAKSSADYDDLVAVLADFPAVYNRLFGNPFDDAVEPLISLTVRDLKLTLPWAEGETWYLTGGAHSGWGTLGALSALDFVTGEGHIGCQMSQGWVTAAADGLVVYSQDGMVLQDVDGDGFMGTGWVLLYMHIAAQDRVDVGTYLSTGDRIGHPSCEGGVSYASHLHFARRYNGVWIAVDDYRWPINLSGWTALPGTQQYEGTMIRGSQVLTACECWEDINAVTHE